MNAVPTELELKALANAAQAAEAAWNTADLKCVVVLGGDRDQANRRAAAKARKAMNAARAAKYTACIAAGMSHMDAIFFR